MLSWPVGTASRHGQSVRSYEPARCTVHMLDGMGPLREYINSTPGAYKCAFDRGTVQVCQDFRQGFQGRGCERYPTGEIYVGEYMAGERYGRGTFRHANGQTLVSSWKDNRPVGEGVQWSADHKKAARLENGVPVGGLSLRRAGEISAKLGMPVPFEWLKDASDDE